MPVFLGVFLKLARGGLSPALRGKQTLSGFSAKGFAGAPNARWATALSTKITFCSFRACIFVGIMAYFSSSAQKGTLMFIGREDDIQGLMDRQSDCSPRDF